MSLAILHTFPKLVYGNKKNLAILSERKLSPLGSDLCLFPAILASYGRSEKIATHLVLKTTQIYSLRILDTRNPKMVSMACSPWRLRGRKRFLAFPTVEAPAFLGSQKHPPPPGPAAQPLLFSLNLTLLLPRMRWILYIERPSQSGMGSSSQSP